jgi:hypothetical protein
VNTRLLHTLATVAQQRAVWCYHPDSPRYWREMASYARLIGASRWADHFDALGNAPPA